MSMQTYKTYKSCSETFTDSEQQERREIIAMVFPTKFCFTKEDLQKLDTDLRKNFVLDEHKEYLINYAFKNHHAEPAKVYRQFLKEKQPVLTEPQMSMFYQNEIFPDLKTLGQFRKRPSQYSRRHVSPLQQGAYVELDELFEEYGYIPNLQRFLTFFPRFLQKIRVVQKQLFEQCKIDQQTTYFLGLCAAAEMGCPYMINRMANKYLSMGGKMDWIENRKYSAKIGSVLSLNRKLGRCLWQFSSQDMQEIIDGGFWNLNQLAIIIQILSFVHMQCVITLGLGLIPEEKNPLISTQKIQKNLNIYRQTKVQSSLCAKKQPLRQVIATLKLIIEQMKNNIQVVQPKISPKRSFKKERKSSGQEQESCIIEPYMKEIGNELTEQSLVIKVLDEMSSFLPKYSPIDKRRDNKSNQFTCTDFNFQFMAFPRLQSLSLVTQSTKKISGMIKQSQEMGYQNFGSEMISTKEFRKAQRYYGENLCGFSHPEYDYKKLVVDEQYTAYAPQVLYQVVSTLAPPYEETSPGLDLPLVGRGGTVRFGAYSFINRNCKVQTVTHPHYLLL